MARSLGSLAVLAILLLAGGCSICCAPYDCNYLYTGGRWIRENPAYGRVGSAFEPVGTRVEGDAPTSTEPMPVEMPAEGMPMQPGMRSVIPQQGRPAPLME